MKSASSLVRVRFDDNDAAAWPWNARRMYARVCVCDLRTYVRDINGVLPAHRGGHVTVKTSGMQSPWTAQECSRAPMAMVVVGRQRSSSPGPASPLEDVL